MCSNNLVHLVVTTHVDAAPIVNTLGHNLHQPSHVAIYGLSASLLHDHSHRCTLIQYPQFALWAFLISRVGEDASIQQGSVGICHHGSDVTGRVRFAVLAIGGFGWELEAVEVIDGLFVPVEGVALVDGVDGAFLGHLHVRVG